ncbi:MAG TPA: response regulator [Oligoflexus sp.]|uniref:response regulator n=1 Tax=Oligoflexus sp. TaxID=1971216 RepID=UPI002D7ED43A|nr:response regulator [Oligoflexus sp.]HET9236955.1 response regulator [Oligoflexus sp.]
MKKVLLIDDDPVFVSIAEKASKDYGFDIVSVSSLKQFKLTNLKGYDAFMVDYDLSDGTGDEVLEILNQYKINRPVALISTTNHVEDADPTVVLHPYTFVSKWQDTESFFQELQRVF